MVDARISSVISNVGTKVSGSDPPSMSCLVFKINSPPYALHFSSIVTIPEFLNLISIGFLCVQVKVKVLVSVLKIAKHFYLLVE